MTPSQKIKHKILYELISEPYNGIELFEFTKITAANVDAMYDELYASDIAYEFREGEVETAIACPVSRHYESKSVASKMMDGSWVGWTYWYGGGKHSDPDSVPWMEDAYNLDLNEEERLVVVQTFTKKPASGDDE